MPIKSLLFDMDSTLIDINENAFSKNYFQLLHQKYFSDFDLIYFYEALTDITRSIMITKIPKEFTIETFIKEMSKRFKQTHDEIYNNLMTFYNNDYNKLEPFIKPMKGVKKLLKKCFDKGFEVIIATTPVFPEIAIRKRLEWGGIGKFDYTLITHAQNMHYSKPREEYYIEILSLIRRNFNECIMVGNEFMGDIVSPNRLGIKTYYCPIPSVAEDLFVSPELKRFSKIKPTYQGSIQDFGNLIDDGIFTK